MRKRTTLLGSAAMALLVLLAGCGSSGNSAHEAALEREAARAKAALAGERQVAREERQELQAAKRRAARKAKEAEAASRPAEEHAEEVAHEAAAEPPNVVGLSLPAAEAALEEAGFKAAPRNTDTAFGIVVPSHYTICKEGAPKGKYVPLLAQKYGC